MSPPASSSLKVDRSGKTLRELSLEKMRAAIAEGHFKPGERLVERNLCEQLDVSRSIVREVLRHLEADGLVESAGHPGPVVARLSQDQARQIYEVRSLLEGRAAAHFAEHASDEAIAALAAAHGRIQQAFEADDFSQVVAHTTAFYEQMFTGAGMAVAWEIVRSLNARINRLRLMTIGSPGRSKHAGTEMNRILRAVRKRDAQAACEAAQAHVNRAAEIAARMLAADER